MEFVMGGEAVFLLMGGQTELLLSPFLVSLTFTVAIYIQQHSNGFLKNKPV
jgi:hypothetical protein